jgi:3-oxoacyl-(acyl-carrier-protein) synthase
MPGSSSPAQKASSQTWRSFSDRDENVLTSEFSNGRPFETESPTFSAVLAHTARDLARIGLWEKGGSLIDPQRLAVCFASSKPNYPTLAQSFTDSTCDAPLSWWARAVGSEGVGYAPVAACAGGAHSVALAAQLIEDGYADAVVAGAWEAPHSTCVLAGYRNAGALSKSGVMRPFDTSRDGFVPSAGAATLVLEREELAHRRGAPILGVISGYSMHADATAMTTMEPSGETIARAIEVALRKAGNLSVDYINAHGTATKLNDAVETRAINHVWGQSVPVSSTKPITGHWLGAAGALEAIICLLALREGWAPPTKNLVKPDEEFNLDYIAMDGRKMPLRRTVSLSYGFGGHIGVLIIEKP